MPGLLTDVDPSGLLEYSVVYTDRALNHMSQSFQVAMNDISSNLKAVYQADGVVVVPGSGTFGMEAVARQFATNRKCLVIRNGWFSYRWTQIFEMGDIPSEAMVLKARRTDSTNRPSFSPPPIDEVVEAIKREKPAVVFAPHVETSAGLILPDEYVAKVGAATRSAGGLFVLDCIASGTVWVDMKQAMVDVLISAPQKGWTGSPCAGLVMLSSRAIERMRATSSTSFSCDLGKWHQIMQAYESGGHAYHATMPTDGLVKFRDVMMETVEEGLEQMKSNQIELGKAVRNVLEKNDFKSVAAEGFGAPGVVVCYTDDPDIHTGKKFREAGIQIAKGVPLRCDEPENFQTFRIGLFGLDKLRNVQRTVDILSKVITNF